RCPPRGGGTRRARRRGAGRPSPRAPPPARTGWSGRRAAPVPAPGWGSSRRVAPTRSPPPRRRVPPPNSATGCPARAAGASTPCSAARTAPGARPAGRGRRGTRSAGAPGRERRRASPGAPARPASHPRARAPAVDDARLALRPPRHAHAAPVEDERVREPGPPVAGDERHEVALDLVGLPLGGEPEKPGDPLHVRVHHDPLVLAEPGAQHHVGRLAAHAGEL